ncbi:MAG: DEAD/DEAH box helicase [Alphaproteobacteria bacterium]|nr:DEAD/DEAH box helicase [Alphaproteobacteria bacterium]
MPTNDMLGGMSADGLARLSPRRAHLAVPWFGASDWGWEQSEGRLEQALARLLEAVRAELSGLGLPVPDRADALPGWTASVAAGCELPRFARGLGDDHDEQREVLVEELRAIGCLVDLPPVRAPGLQVLSHGSLVARHADAFALELLFRDGGRGAVAAPVGPRWTRCDGSPALVPAELVHSLADLESGPPARDAQESDVAWADRRMLWWARIRPVLEHHGAELVGAIATTWAVEIESPAPLVELAEDGTAQVSIVAPVGAPAGLSPKEIGESLDRLPPSFANHPGFRVAGPGGRQRVRVVSGRRGVEALRKLRDLREQARHDPEVAAQLVEAPHTLLDPDLFDLSQYSDRVIGVRPVLYRIFRAPPHAGASRPRYRLLPAGGGATHADDLAPRLTPEQRADLERRLSHARQRGRPYIRWSPGAGHGAIWVRVPPEEVLRPDDTPGEGEATTQGQLDVALNIEDLLYGSKDQGDGVAVSARARIDGLREGFVLKPYQVEGVGWLAGHSLVVDGASDHGLLADDMGLGKTLQVLCLMRILQLHGHMKPTLVVAPLSLLQNWAAEAEKFFPRAFGTPLLLGGPGSPRPTAERVRAHALTLVSYEALRLQQIELGKVQFELMVLDESHRIKNPTTSTTRAVLAMHATRRLALSGTPVQNTLVDLWSQMDWLSPGFLDALPTFRQRCERSEDGSIDELRQQMVPRLLRRMKREVLADELPPMRAPEIRLSMPPVLDALYSEVQQSDDGGRGSFRKLHQLLRCCAHPAYLTDDSVPDPKRIWLRGLLREVHRRGEKVLVFAEWHDLQAELCAEVEREYGVRVERINGTVHAGHRLAIVDDFNRAPGFRVLVLGPKAAGVGLNITGANHVVHYTRHWNPSHEMQATDRAYRIGQTRPVTVYRPILTRDEAPTIEEYMDELLREKLELARDVIVPTAKLDISGELSARVCGEER